MLQQSIHVQVDTGMEVRLVAARGVVQTIHLHNVSAGGEREIKASMTPVLLMRTQDVRCLPGNNWINSIEPKSGRLLHKKFPYAWVARSGWFTKAKSRWWPVLASKRCWGHTPMRALANLRIVYERTVVTP